ncbi:MAG: AAA family ATPase [Planctomycetes bacterium]|nr:AAA family ATPase [Planctomycetota bacterium]
MIRRIRIKGYKSLQDLEVRLQPLCVLFGPNAAGKSNFLDALQLLSGIARTRSIKEAFAPPYRGLPLESFAFGPEGMSELVRRNTASFSIEVDLELSDSIVQLVDRQVREMKQGKEVESGSDGGDISSSSFVRERCLRYRIEIEVLPQSGILRVADEYLTALNQAGEPSGKRKPFLERIKDRLHLRMEGQAHPTYLELLLDHSVLSRPLYPPHYPHLVAVRHELASWLFFYFEPRERMRAPNPVKEVRHIGVMGEDLAAFLNTLRAIDPKQFVAIEKSIRMIIPSVTGIDVEVNNLGEVELRLKEGGTPVPARVVSEGTLRVLGLLALVGAKDRPALLGFEEPENGIHPRRIQAVAELLRTYAEAGKTQLIVTTHSPILPDLLPDQSLYVCRKSQGQTDITPFASWGELARASEIGRALDAEEGTTPVSQRILRGDFDA